MALWNNPFPTLIFSLAINATSATACVPPMGYRTPTNFELVREADLIVLARVIAGPPANPRTRNWGANGIVLHPVAVLKGRAPSTDLTVYGSLFDFDGRPVKPAPTSLSEPTPSSGDGSCVRRTYSLGGLVVGMFRSDPGGFSPLEYPAGRQVEDVDGPDATWVRAVKLYVGALSPSPTTERAALHRLELGLKATHNPGDAEIARDIHLYLRGRRAGRMVEFPPRELQ